MCAIFGIVGNYDAKRARSAFATLAHRGQDASTIIEQNGLFLAHHRLYIFDKDAKQSACVDKKIVLFNGEIYNYKDFANTESAAIAKASLAKLRGMFALALYDGKKLFLAKDRFGKKPLYYYKGSDFFIFASEIKAILTYIQKARFNRFALSGYLSYGAIPNEMTMYEGIYKVCGGEVVEVDIKSLHLQKRQFASLLQKSSLDIEEALREAVTKRLHGDFEVAALLSGGVDSSFVSAVAKKAQGKLATYSIGYKEQKYSELPFAEEVANYIGSEHTEVVFGKEDFFATFEAMLEHFDEPIGDSASVPLAFLFGRIAKDNVRVVLSGEGGDEIFLGYRQYFEFLDLYRAKNLKYKNWLKNYFRSHFSPNKEWEWYKRVFSDEVIFRSSCEIFTDLQKNLFLRQNVRDNESLIFLQKYLRQWQESGWEEEVDFFTFIDLKVRLEALYLHKLDMTSMAHTIEARTPLLDEEVLASAFGHPLRAKEPKYLLKHIAKKYIPSSIIERKKRGFSYPYMQWLQKSSYIQKMAKINEEAGFFKPEQLQFLIQNAKRNRFSRHFWVVLAFLLWYERKF